MKKVISLFLISLFIYSTIYAKADIEHISPILKNKINQLQILAKKQGIEFKVICGYRSQSEQDRLYAQGRTIPGRKVTWTRNSKHTQGKAFDVAVIKDGKITWERKDYEVIGKLGKSLGLTWGGDWKCKDMGHFEIGG